MRLPFDYENGNLTLLHTISSILHLRLAVFIALTAAMWFSGCGQSVSSRLAEGARLLERGEYTRASEMFGQVLATNKQNTAARLGRGKTIIALKDQQGALKEFDAGLLASPNNVELLLGRAGLLEAMPERLPDVERDYTAVLGVDKRSVKALLGRAFVLRGLGKHADATTTKGK